MKIKAIDGWTLHGNQNKKQTAVSITIRSQEGFAYVAEITQKQGITGGDWHNARVIRAAPEMFAVLKAMSQGGIVSTDTVRDIISDIEEG